MATHLPTVSCGVLPQGRIHGTRTSPRRHSCLSTETGTMAFVLDHGGCLRFRFRQRDGHFCLATGTGTMAFLAVTSGGTSDSVHRQCGRHSCLATETVLTAGSIHVFPEACSRTLQEQTVLPRHSLSQVRHISPFPTASTDPLPSKCHEVCTGNP